MLSTLKFKKGQCPITLEVSSGFATMGSYILGYKKIGEDKFKEFGNIEPKSLETDLMFSIPICFDDLSTYEIVIIGKYSPAPGEKQIKVKYEFFQEGKALKMQSENGNVIEVTTEEGIERFTHIFRFEEEN